jgi:hypothetical protein
MSKVYKYTLDVDYVYENILPGIDDGKYIISRDGLSIIIKDGTVTVKAGYSWDGCSPKIKIGSKIIGTPDGRYDETKRASCIHDALYQIHRSVRKLKRITVDKIFRDELLKANWKLTKVYYDTVRALGGLYWNK